MKRLESGPDGAAWNSDLVKQLGFIKKRLRYPFSRHTAGPFILLAAMVPAIGFMIYTVVFTRSTSSYRPIWLPFIIISILIITMIVKTWRYLKTLRFINVPAGHSLAENMLLLQQFLQAHHFAVGRHPQMPEVFQILSKNISSLNDAREVVIFIADDKRILVNSHFINGRFNAPVGVPHYLQLAKLLAEFIENQKQSVSLERTFRTY